MGTAMEALLWAILSVFWSDEASAAPSVEPLALQSAPPLARASAAQSVCGLEQMMACLSSVAASSDAL